MQTKTSPEKVKRLFLSDQGEGKDKSKSQRPEQQPLQKLEPEQQQEGKQKAEERAIKLTTRDRELLGHVAVIKYAAERHLQRLVFVAPVLEANRKRRTGEPLAVNVMRRRLQQLSRGSGTLLRAVEYRDAEGVPRRAYCVTALGYNIAGSVLKASPPLPPSDRSGDHHIAHVLALNDLYVELATARKSALPRAGSLPFTWRSESMQLPWREFNVRRGDNDERRLVPDGILEIAQAKTRVFIECEMGGHPIARQANSENDSVLNKLERYAKFVHLIGGKSHYAQRFADQWKPVLLFLVRTPGRAATIETSLTEWRAANPDHPLAVRAADLHGAASALAPRMGLPPPAPRKLEIAADDAAVLATALQQTVALCKSVRHYLREHPSVREQGCPYPEYPAQLERALRLADTLRAQATDGAK